MPRGAIRYTISILALLTASPAAAQVAVAAPGADTVDEVVVTGLRRSLQSARTIKRDAAQVVDAVVAEDIGKLPDVTASDSLARIVGVQVERGGGEANRVLVRGLPDLTTTYNGRDIFTAEARFVAIQDFPAGGVAALEVFKSTTADQVEGGIAGLINVRSRRAFDFKDREIAGSLRAAYTNQSEHYDPTGNILVSDRWTTGAGEIGALLNVSYTRLRYLDSARFNGGFIAAAESGQVADPALTGFRFPDAVGVFYGQGDRSRPSVNASLQWRPNAHLELYADALYQGFRNKVSDRQLLVPLHSDSGAIFSNVVLQPGTNQAQSLTSSGQLRPELFQGASSNQTDTFQFAVGGSYEQGPWRVTADLARTDSKYDSSIYSFDTAFARAPTVDVNFDVPGHDGGVAFGFRDFDVQDPANYVYRGFFDRHLVAKGDDIQFRSDATYDFGEHLIRSVQFGVRYVDRDGAFDNGERYAGQEALGLPLTATPVDLAPIPSGFNGDDVQVVRSWISPTRQSLRRNISALRDLAGFPGGEPPFNPQQAFEAKEKSYAGYGQINYATEGRWPVDGVIGLRVVRTRETISGSSRGAVGGVETFTPRDEGVAYTDYLPSVSARLHLGENTQLRLAANKTRTRPSFSQLNPSLAVDPNPDPSGRRNARGGNIDLQPIESENYDLTLERYFSATGSASVGLFRRKVSGFIADQTVDVTDPVYGQLRVTQPQNLSDATLKGVEAQVTTFLDYEFMPGWARSFGVQLNGTYIHGDLPGISEYSYNLVGMYERGPISARLAWNTRTQYTGSVAGEYTDDVSRLDFSASYSPVEDITVTFEASNILGEPYRSFLDYGGGVFPRDVRFEESIYALGIRFRR